MQSAIQANERTKTMHTVKKHLFPLFLVFSFLNNYIAYIKESQKLYTLLSKVMLCRKCG